MNSIAVTRISFRPSLKRLAALPGCIAALTISSLHVGLAATATIAVGTVGVLVLVVRSYSCFYRFRAARRDPTSSYRLVAEASLNGEVGVVKLSASSVVFDSKTDVQTELLSAGIESVKLGSAPLFGLTRVEVALLDGQTCTMMVTSPVHLVEAALDG